MLLSKEKIYSEQPQNHKHVTATCSNILKTLCRPNKTGLLAEGACQPPVPILSSICFLGDPIQNRAFIYHLCTQNATFLSLTHKFNCLLNIFSWMPQTHLKFNLSQNEINYFLTLHPLPSKAGLPWSSFVAVGVGGVRGDKTKTTEV